MSGSNGGDENISRRGGQDRLAFEVAENMLAGNASDDPAALRFAGA